MRLHRVEVQAFGPFAGREEVDVDALAEHGLFLLHGPTGAGKTSVLDAVCFALYGRVPGARGSGTRLRSDHAAAGTPPEVVVEIEVGGRRFEVTRSPAWDRPKRRGSGVTTEPAKTLLRERVAGTWSPLSSRNDEASQLLTDVLGMGLEQFTRVVLLPQGEFATFLRASAEERRPLLQRLFGTDRFAEVEKWLAERRRVLARELEQADAALGRLLAQVEHAAASARAHEDAEGAEDAEDSAQASDLLEPEDQVAAAIDTVEVARQRRRLRHESATRDRSDQGRRVDELREEARRWARLEAALTEKRVLDSRAGAVTEVEKRLAAAQAAASVAGDLRAAAQAGAEADHAQQALRRARADVERLVREPVAADCSDALLPRARELRQELGRLGDLLDLERRTSACQERHAGLQQSLTAARAAVEALDRRLEDATRQQAQHVRAVERLQVPAGDAALRREELARAEQVLAATQTAVRLNERALRQQADLSSATDTAQQTRQEWLDLRERRLAGMASELARDLVDGEPCAVCGACQHPRPAAATASAVRPEDEDAAARAAEEAGQRRRELADALSGTREELAGQVVLSLGLDRRGAAARHVAAEAAHAVAQEAVRELEHHRKAAERRRLEVEEVASERSRRLAEIAALAAEAAEVDSALRSQTATLAAALDGDPSIAARRDRLELTADALDALCTALDRGAAATASAATAGHAAGDAARRAGFGSVDEAAAALLPDAELRHLAEQVRDHRATRDALLGRLADPELRQAEQERAARAAAGSADDDVRQRLLEEAAALAEADARAERSAADVAVAEAALRSLQVLREQVAAEVAATAPLRTEHAQVDELATCTAGTGGGNALRMPLSSYVLAARLEQVAAAATVRLDEMSGGRFALVHSDAAERGGRRSGLGLQVLDGWTGSLRTTASLSGGESFIASLSLALGLADVVQAEAGGTAIETLFVDEGFGTLDPETLEEVMEVLDALRDGGRCVGLISHVQELRQRIPSRLEVVKTRAGSHLRVECGAA